MGSIQQEPLERQLVLRKRRGAKRLEHGLLVAQIPQSDCQRLSYILQIGGMRSPQHGEIGSGGFGKGRTIRAGADSDEGRQDQDRKGEAYPGNLNLGGIAVAFGLLVKGLCTGGF